MSSSAHPDTGQLQAALASQIAFDGAGQHHPVAPAPAPALASASAATAASASVLASASAATAANADATFVPSQICSTSGDSTASPQLSPSSAPADAARDSILSAHFGLPDFPPPGHARVFYSVDPARGTLDVYPRRFCVTIDDAIRGSKGAAKGEVYLGKQFFDATVRWRHAGASPAGSSGPFLYQTTPGGSIGGSLKRAGLRDVWVKDVAVAGSRELRHNVRRVNFEWTGCAAERVSEGDASQRVASAIVPEEHFAVEAEEEPAPFWQWCKRTDETMSLIPLQERATGRSSIFNVSDRHWGFYTEEVNTQIQAAHAAGKSHVDIVLCSRQYRISFERNHIYAKQIDPILRKERMVRLVYLKPSDVVQRMANEACNLPDGEVCPICLLEFQETPTIQVITLPCHHQFHGICIQNVADKNQKCPYCRSEVDWVSLFATYGNSVGTASR